MVRPVGHEYGYGDGEESVLLVPGTLRGFRSWRLEDTTLRSTFAPAVWHPGLNTARCHLSAFSSHHDTDRASPVSTCQCGFYGLYTPDWSVSRVARLVGVVEVSGKVVLGTKGFRAEKARVVALAPAPGSSWGRRLLYHLSGNDDCYDCAPTWPKGGEGQACAERYGADYFPSPRKMLKKYPPQDVSELLA